MEIHSMSPAFTGRRLATKEVNELLSKKWTIPVGVSDLGIKSKTSFAQKFSNFIDNIRAFFKRK